MEDEKNVGTYNLTAEEKAGVTEATAPKTLDDIVSSDKEIQAQLDKKISQALNTERAKWTNKMKKI